MSTNTREYDRWYYSQNKERKLQYQRKHAKRRSELAHKRYVAKVKAKHGANVIVRRHKRKNGEEL